MTTTTKALAILPALAVLASCAGRPKPAPSGPPQAGTLDVRVLDHLGFGLRLEAVAVRIDGRPVRRAQDDGERSGFAPMPIAPGVHGVSAVARVSLSCGLLPEPRAYVTVRAAQNFRVGAGPASLDLDLFARAPTSNPSDMAAVAITGRGVALGVKEARRAGAPQYPSCEGLEPVAAAACDVEAALDDARADRDVARSLCSVDRLTEIRKWRRVLDDATHVASSDGTTNDDAMHAQLRARYAESRVRALADEAKRCIGSTDPAADAAPDQACPRDALSLGAVGDR
jgi:hypothetical protein